MKTLHSAHSIIALVSAIREEANALIVNSLAKQNITDVLPAHGAVLNALFHCETLSMKDLAEAIGKKKNTVTGLINTLEERGYCQRQVSPEDGRSQNISLTEKGRAMRTMQETISQELLHTAWSGIDEATQRATVAALDSILQNLQKKNGR